MPGTVKVKCKIGRIAAREYRERNVYPKHKGVQERFVRTRKSQKWTAQKGSTENLAKDEEKFP